MLMHQDHRMSPGAFTFAENNMSLNHTLHIFWKCNTQNPFWCTLADLSRPVLILIYTLSVNDKMLFIGMRALNRTNSITSTFITYFWFWNYCCRPLHSCCESQVSTDSYDHLLGILFCQHNSNRYPASFGPCHFHVEDAGAIDLLLVVGLVLVYQGNLKGILVLSFLRSRS
jgi:hypothetical protein